MVQETVFTGYTGEVNCYYAKEWRASMGEWRNRLRTGVDLAGGRAAGAKAGSGGFSKHSTDKPAAGDAQTAVSE